MSRAKVVWAGEWVSVLNCMNTKFKAAAPCSQCAGFRAEPVWYSIKTREVRCKRCFDAEAEHQVTLERMEDEDGFARSEKTS